MDLLHWVFLILWILTVFTLFPFLIGFFVLMMKLKGGAMTRGVYCVKIMKREVRRFFCRWDKGHWKKSTGAAGEFEIIENTGTITAGKGFTHKINENDCFIHEGKKDTIIIDGLSRMNLEFHKKYQLEKAENLKLKSQLAEERLKNHRLEGRINQRAIGLSEHITKTASQITMPFKKPSTTQKK
jgi:hypothetical protein